MFIYKDRYATEIVTDGNKICMHMFFYLTCLYQVYMTEDINLL